VLDTPQINAIMALGEIPPLRRLWNERLTSARSDHR